jgi:hypothetical protein
MAEPTPQETKTSREAIAVFYLERLMDQLDRQCFLLAHRTFVRHRSDFSLILDESLLDNLQRRVQSEAPKDSGSLSHLIEKVTHAVQFGEYRAAYDFGTEYILANDRPNPSNGHVTALETIRNLLADACWHFLEPDDVQINTFVNAEIGFIVSRRGVSTKTGQPLDGDPGFTWVDAVGQRYRCFVKQVPHVQVGDLLHLKITNVTNTFIHNAAQGKERVIYLEPRVQSGDHIPIEIDSLSHTGNSFTFRLHSYDGFLWFKRRGVNKDLFNERTLQAGDHVLAEVLYTTEEVSPQRLGLLKAIPIKRLDAPAKTGPDKDVATTPS